MNLERDETIRYTGGELPLQRFAPDEGALAHPHEAIEPGLQRRVVARQVTAPHAVGLLQAERFHGPHARHTDAKLGAGGEYRVEQVVRVLNRKVQFPAERAHEVDAQQVHFARQAHIGDLAGEPGEGGVVERRVDESGQHLARAGTCHDETAARGGDIAQLHRAVGGEMALQEVRVIAFGGAGAHDVEVFRAHLADRELGADAAAGGQRVAQGEASDLRRDLVGDQRVEPGRGARARHLVLGEGRQIDDADAAAQFPALVADVRKIIAAPEAPHVAPLHAGRREPVGTLPAIALAEDRAHAFELVVDRAGLRRPRIRAFLVREMGGEDVAIGLLILGREVAAARIGPKAPGIDRQHVNPGFALDDPFGQLPAGAAGRRDSEAVAFVEPQIPHTPAGPDQGAAVGRVGNRSIDDLLDPAILERGHAPLRRLDVRHHAVQIAVEQALAEPFRHAIGEACRSAFLVGSEDPAEALLAQIIGLLRLAQHRQLAAAALAVLR